MKPIHPFANTNAEFRAHSYVEEVSAFAAKEKAKSRRRNFNPIGPTPERVRKTANGMMGEISPPIRDEDTRANTRTAVIINTWDDYQGWLKNREELLAVVRQLHNDFALANSGPSLISSYGDAPGSVPGPRNGGVPDHAREAQARVTLMLSQFDEAFARIINDFIIDGASDPSGTPARLEDLGRRICNYKAPRDNTMVGLGAFWSALVRAREFYQRERALGSGAASTASEVRARIQARREATSKRDNSR